MRPARAARPSAVRTRAPRRRTASSTSHATVTSMPCKRPAERLDRAEAAVGRRAAAHRDDHLTESFTTRDRDQLTGSARRRAQRIVAPHRRARARSPRHLDDRDAAGQHPPLRVDRIAERPGDTRRARREPPRAASSASSVPSPPSASGSSTTSSNPARSRPGRDRGRGRRRPTTCRGTCRDRHDEASSRTRRNRLTAR